MRIRYAGPAKQDLIEIQDYVARDDEAAAHRLAQRIREQIARLSQHPHLGRPGRIADTPELSISRTPYIAVYRIRRSRIEVLTIIHTRRRWPP